MRATGIFLPQTTETSRLAQYLDVESEPDMIDITSDTSSSMEEEGNWTPPELQGSPPPELQGLPPPEPQGSPPPELQGSPPPELQGGAGASDADFDVDMYPQPDRTVSCTSPARTSENHNHDLVPEDTLTTFPHYTLQFYIGAAMDDAPLLDRIQDLLLMRTDPTDVHTCAFGKFLLWWSCR